MAEGKSSASEEGWILNSSRPAGGSRCASPRARGSYQSTRAQKRVQWSPATLRALSLAQILRSVPDSGSNGARAQEDLVPFDFLRVSEKEVASVKR